MLKSLLEHELETLTSLREILQKERQQLRHPMSASLELLKAQKLKQLHSLQQISEERAVLFEAANLSVDGDGMAELIRNNPAEEHYSLLRLWRLVCSEGLRCNKLNAINSAIANHDEHDIPWLLNMTYSDPNQSSIYDSPKFNR